MFMHEFVCNKMDPGIAKMICDQIENKVCARNTQKTKHIHINVMNASVEKSKTSSALGRNCSAAETN